ncbi:LysM peptidoglycan-binding domain-containing protein [Nocardioides sp. T2.26MG-1]|uniref:LysM peptidoglycan-binding domain-containing protein n=1 Tax=Nocardioides sp. T2.26MG-1 TaxID=3041166 RepID=UPI0024779A81|nr:LysM peptidoglycan-binding domain-containing protein [Nocardioides sp. T2.26MG-1]CAI9416254.1 Cell division suppressor protein YneA [Nocardioides sp. T2.26MG-1]
MSTMTIGTTHIHPVRPTRQARPGSVRLTRRGRLVVLAIAVFAILTVGFVLAGGSVATSDSGTPEPTRVVMVGAGDTLWDIAAGLSGDGDVRAMVDHIQRLNALDSGMVTAGQRLLVPVE